MMSTIALEKPLVFAGKAGKEKGVAMVSFAVADKWFAVEEDSVQAVLEADCLEVVGGGDSTGLMGIAETRGEDVLVRDMSVVLVPGSASRPAEQIIVLRGAKFLAGLITASTAEMVSIAKERIGGVGDSRDSSEHVKGTCQIWGRTVTVLDAEALVENIVGSC